MPKEKSYEDIASQVNNISRQLVERADKSKDTLHAADIDTGLVKDTMKVQYDPDTRAGSLSHYRLDKDGLSHTSVEVGKPGDGTFLYASDVVPTPARDDATEVTIAIDSAPDSKGIDKIGSLPELSPELTSHHAARMLGHMRDEVARRNIAGPQ